ncbi:CDP-glycerol glycerophosphotransferase family protein [Campylobacter sp. RM10543]|uniref:CDP-glycerol glycerophosphotransferase family protein n=1 Tax=Campylobacter molothri TaxID=1032242 RepID=UPI00301CA4CD|nr:CDP-glycerol glycerophosphotransferase family protein [Campylobacter sp. RM10543]
MIFLKQIIFQCLYSIFFYINKNKRKNITVIYSNASKIYSNLACIENELKIKNIKYKISFNGKKLKDLFIISKASIIFIDQSNYFLSYIKINSSVKVIQCWHGGGLYKAIGFDNGMAHKISRNYRNISFLNISDGKLKQNYSSMFNISAENITCFGLPRADLLFKKNILDEKKIFYELYPALKNKKICLYAPTFRERGKTREQVNLLNIESINNHLKDYVIIYRKHPTLDEKCANIVDVSHLNLDFVLAITDILISDYSSIIFDFAYFKKPIILYVPDLENYKKTRKLYLHPEELVGKNNVCYSEKEIISFIENASYEKDLWSDYMSDCKGNSSKQLIDFALTL